MVKKEIKIYYGKKLIRLANFFPSSEPADTMVIYYDQENMVGHKFIEFSENDSFSTLFLWSGSRYRELKRVFFSLFRIIEAAGGVVKNEKDEILVIFRNGTWDLPKGKVERNMETFSEAAIREVREETGLKKLSLSRKLMTTHHLYLRKEMMILKPTHWYEMFARSSCKLNPDSKENITEVKWVRKEDIAEIISNTYESLKDLFSLIRLYQPGI